MADHSHQLIRAGRDDRGSIVLALLLVMIGTMLAGLLVPVVVTQAQAARFDTRRDQSLDAAQAGVDIALGKIRDAVDSDGGGTLTGLPCTATDTADGPLTGAVSPDGTERYSITVHYFGSDPRGHIDGSDTWLGDATKEIKCASGGLLKTPSYAVIVSQGTATSSGDFSDVPIRTVEATYTFKVLNSNVLGGLITLNSTNYCLDAGASPQQGTVPTLQACDPTDAGQLWAFNGSNQVLLANSPNTSSGYLGLCMYAPYNASGSFTRSPGTALSLLNCANPGDNSSAGKSALRKQQWGFQGFYPLDFIGTDSDGGQSDINNLGIGACWQPTAKLLGRSLVMNACSTDNTLSLTYNSAVGAGNSSALVPNNASKPTSFQNALGYVNNYGEFGRCLDDTYGDVPQVTYKYMIAYFCRSSPDPASYPTDAQLWHLPVVKPGQIYATSQIHLTYDVAPPAHTHTVDRRSYCLTSYPSMTTKPYLQPCNGTDNNPWSSGAATQAWTLSGDTGDYGTSYQIKDSFGHCLQPDQSQYVPSNILAGQIHMIVVATCTSSTLQKWNAPPGATPSPLRDYHEK